MSRLGNFFLMIASLGALLSGIAFLLGAFFVTFEIYAYFWGRILALGFFGGWFFAGVAWYAFSMDAKGAGKPSYIALAISVLWCGLWGFAMYSVVIR